MKTKLGLLYGGKSAEHKVSLQTAKAVINALDLTKFEIHPIYITIEGSWIRGAEVQGIIDDIKELQFSGKEKTTPIPKIYSETFPIAKNIGNNEGGIDVVFPLLHGPNGEDGTVQGMLELLNIPYVGNGVLASSAGMDKVIMKNIFEQANINQPNYISYIRSEWEEDQEVAYKEVEEKLGYPCFVKPANLGSSVGISKCKDREELKEAFVEAFVYDRKVIIEEGIEGREIEIALLGNDHPECSVVGEIIPNAEFYDYESKYEDEETGLIIPASITDAQYDELKEVAIQSFKALDCSGLVRADFFLSNDGEILMNEVNTMPGFTPVSMFPMLWQKSGVAYASLIEKLVELGIERYEEKQKIKHTF